MCRHGLDELEVLRAASSADEDRNSREWTRAVVLIAFMVLMFTLDLIL